MQDTNSTEHQPSPRLAAQPGHVHSSRGPRRDHDHQSEGSAPHVEKLITLGKKGDLHSGVRLSPTSRPATQSRGFFDTVAPRYGDRNGGYLRIVRTGFQKGDGAEKAFIELLGAEAILDEKRQKRAESPPPSAAKRCRSSSKSSKQQLAEGGEAQA